MRIVPYEAQMEPQKMNSPITGLGLLKEILGFSPALDDSLAPCSRTWCLERFFEEI
jgi:hypothetical protein